LHCFALDGAAHFLFHPFGTHSLSNPKDFQLMKEMSYQDSLKSKHIACGENGTPLADTT
jgi:hypothetical protein